MFMLVFCKADIKEALLLKKSPKYNIETIKLVTKNSHTILKSKTPALPCLLQVLITLLPLQSPVNCEYVSCSAIEP